MVQPIKTSSTIGYKIAIVILILIIIGLFVFLPRGISAEANQAKAEENVKELYKVITGGDVEILKTTEQSGVYKVVVRFRDVTGRDVVQDAFVTKDGTFFTDSLLDINLQKSLLANQSAFAQCLANKQVSVIGLANDPLTQAQLAVLGAFSARVYVDCSGQNAALCQQLNITRVPMIFFNNSLVQGPLNLQWFEQNVGCFMAANATAG